MDDVTDHRIATEDAMRAIRGEGPPPLVIDKRLGLSLDLVTGRCVCAKCGMDTLSLTRAIALPSFLDPETVIAGMRCRTCEAEQAVSLEQQSGAVILGTSLPRG
jgi:hypothetical protein